MKDKLLMALGLGRLMIGEDYVGESYREELKRMGRRVLRTIRPGDD